MKLRSSRPLHQVSIRRSSSRWTVFTFASQKSDEWQVDPFAPIGRLFSRFWNRSESIWRFLFCSCATSSLGVWQRIDQRARFRLGTCSLWGAACISVSLPSYLSATSEQTKKYFLENLFAAIDFGHWRYPSQLTRESWIIQNHRVNCSLHSSPNMSIKRCPPQRRLGTLQENVNFEDHSHTWR